MVVRNAGTASIRIKPDAGDFIHDLRLKLAALNDPGFSIAVGVDLTAARREMELFRAEQQALGLNLNVAAYTTAASAHMAAWRAAQAANHVDVTVNVHTNGATAQIGALRRQMDGLGNKPLLGALALGAFQPATAGLAQVAAGLQQVAQAGLVVPGAIAGAVASIGTLALGLSGVKSAWDAVSKASDSAGEDQAASARAASSASNQLRNAVVDETQARKDQARAYRDARQQLTDLNVEMRGGLISESRAILEAQKAREDLSKGNFSDIRDAQLRILEADQRVIEVRARNTQVAGQLNDAQAKGVEGSDLVVAANERVVRSQQQVADAQAAVADTAGKGSAAQKAAAQAMDELSPSARKFVETLIELRPAFDEVRDAAQEPLFEGKAEEFRRFFTDVAPNIKQGLSGIATAWNQNITALLTSLGSDQGKSILDRILGNTGEAQSRFSAAIDPLVRGMGTLAAAGSDALPRLADAIGSVATRFADFIEGADKDGRLDRWINDGLDGMASLGNSVINVSKIFTGITQAAGGGGSFLKWLENLTNKWQEFVNSAEGQSELKEFFREGLEQLQHWGALLKELPGAFKSMADGAAPYLGVVVDLFKTLAGFVGEHPDLVKTAILAYLGWKTATLAIGAVQTAMLGLSGMITQVGTGFYPLRQNAQNAMNGVNDTFTRAGHAGSPVRKFAGALAALGTSVAGAGALGALAMVAIPAVGFALDKLNEDYENSKKRTQLFIDKQNELAEALDKVSGKITEQGLDKLIQDSRNFDTGPGSTPGLTKGNALEAADLLKIQPDLYIRAQAGDVQAQQQVRDVITKNNLIPEFNANPEIAKRVRRISEATGGRIDQDAVIAALLNNPGALAAYDAAISEASQGMAGDQRAQFNDVQDLNELRKLLSPTGQASGLVGQRLNQALGLYPGALSDQQLQNQAKYGQVRISQQGMDIFGPQGGSNPTAMVNAGPDDVAVSVPNLTDDQKRKLDGAGIKYGQNPDKSWTVRLPKDSPLVEPGPQPASQYIGGGSFKEGGPVPGGRGDGPTGGHLIEAGGRHGREWVLPEHARNAIGDETLWALTKGRKLQGGGNIDENGNPIQPGMLPGPSTPPAPIAPNPMANSGGISGIVSNVVSGIQGPIGNAISLGQGLLNNGQQQNGGGGGLTLGPMDPASVSARASQVPGLIGLLGSMNSADPDTAVANWNTKTTKWMADWSTKLVGGLTSALWDGGGNGGGLLGFFGLENSILSSSNPYNQAATRGAQFALGDTGPIGTLLGINGSGSASGTGGVTDPAALASQYNVLLDDATLAELSRGNVSAIPGLDAAATGGSGKSGGGLVPNAARLSQMAKTLWPGLTGVGGYSPNVDQPWDEHQTGEAVDLMVGKNAGLGDQIKDYLMKNAAALGVQYVIWKQHLWRPDGSGYDMPDRGSPTENHFDHAHVRVSRGSGAAVPGMATGGPTPSRKGPGPTGGFFAEVHPDEFMISARGRASVPDSFLHALNKGQIDPNDLPRFGNGGDPAAALVIPPPRPNFDPGQGIKPQIVRPPSVPTQPRPAPAPAPTPAPVAPAPADSEPAAPPTTTAGTPAQQQPTIGVPQGVAPAPSSIDHNLGWVNQAISSGASTLGNLVSSAISMGAAAGGGGMGGGMGAGLASSLVSGLFQQGGKVVTDAANVVSSFLVGNVPGSFGDPNMPAYGRVNMPAQNRPATAPYRGGNTYMISGHDTADVLREADNNEALERQGILATRRG